MALYDSLFTMMDMTAAQLLVTAADFEHKSFRESLAATAEDLLEMNVIPVFNENDAVLSSRLPPTVRFNRGSDTLMGCKGWVETLMKDLCFLASLPRGCVRPAGMSPQVVV